MAQPPASGAGAGPGSGDISSELESFRQQWRAEVKAKTIPSGPARQPRSGGGGPSSSAGARTAPAPARVPAPARPQREEQTAEQQPAVASLPPAVPAPPPPMTTTATTATSQRASAGLRHGAPETPMRLLSSGKKLFTLENDDDYAQPRAFDELVDEYGRALPATASSGPAPAAADEGVAKPEPQSALEHYEKAVEKEAVGSLGDSLNHYRKAFRMDSAVDKKYKNKHFPAAPAPAAALPGGSKDGLPVAAAKPAREGPPPTLKELVASFAGLSIEAAAPPIEGMPPPPCPLASLPDELLVHILRDVAVDDVGDFVRLARVCRKLAFLVATEDRIWRRVCLGPEFGFACMHRQWQRAIAWGPLVRAGEAGAHDDGDGDLWWRRQQARQQADSHATTVALFKGVPKTGPESSGGSGGSSSSTAVVPPVYPSWQRMFRLRPRIRFNGCYISTVNYIRPGQVSASFVTWNSPVHIVTYFRYLRFFRDGTVISLLTTTEPADVVHVLTKDLVALHEGGAMPHLPSAVMQNALRGRWRMSGIGCSAGDGEGEGDGDGASATSTVPPPPAPSPFSSLAAAVEAENDVVVETEGVGKYYYRMELAFRTAGKGARNNKLNWRGFYSYNRLTDDWGEFGLKNDRPFFFSRVRSYGNGE